METVRLYYGDPYLKEFTATVTDCRRENGVWLVTLDRTAFYPAGGGQPCDTGMLAGARVVSVHEADGVIIHCCTATLDTGAVVSGKIDWKRRFDFMQQHSGEHIISGIICRRFCCDNVGFHIGAEVVTIDFNSHITLEQLKDAELEANEYIWADIPSEVLYPDMRKLASTAYRSKKELAGPARLVRFQGADICACCGTHVKSSGQVGVIKLLSCVKFRNGVRIELLCGRRAFSYLDGIQRETLDISKTLSSPALRTAQAVGRLKSELEAEKYRAVGLENRLFSQIAEARRGSGTTVLFEPGLGADALRRLAVTVSASCGGLCAAFSGENGDYKYVVSHPTADLSSLAKSLNTCLSGRGGGRNTLIQGSVTSSLPEIEAFFANLK